MSRFRSVNRVELLFPTHFGMIHRIKRIEQLPVDYDELPFLHERTDLIDHNERLQISDKVYLTIERPDFQEYYEISCLREGCAHE